MSQPSILKLLCLGRFMKVLNDIVVVLTEVPIIVCGKTSILNRKAYFEC